MKVVEFEEGRFQPVKNGEQTVVLRRYNKGQYELKSGQRFYGNFQSGNRTLKRMLLATATTVLKPLNRLTDEEARSAGYDDRWDAQRSIKADHPDMAHTDKVAVIRFEMAQPASGAGQR